MRKKVLLGFILLGTVLFLSSIIAIFEFGRMSRNISEAISDNILSANTARELLLLVDDFNTKILEDMGDDESYNFPESDFESRFVDYINIYNETETHEYRYMIDSVTYSFSTFMQLIGESESVWPQGPDIRREWYRDRLHPVFLKLRNYINKLTESTENSLSETYYSMKSSFFRGIIPGVVTVGVGIILIILFNYFLNSYLINPLMRINKGVSGYMSNNKSYDVTVEGDDDISQLNSAVKDLIDENKTLKKIKY